jgi:hypothetical protein
MFELLTVYRCNLYSNVALIYEQSSRLPIARLALTAVFIGPHTEPESTGGDESTDVPRQVPHHLLTAALKPTTIRTYFML